MPKNKFMHLLLLGPTIVTLYYFKNSMKNLQSIQNSAEREPTETRSILYISFSSLALGYIQNWIQHFHMQTPEWSGDLLQTS